MCQTVIYDSIIGVVVVMDHILKVPHWYNVNYYTVRLQHVCLSVFIVSTSLGIFSGEIICLL